MLRIVLEVAVAAVLGFLLVLCFGGLLFLNPYVVVVASSLGLAAWGWL